MFKKITILIMAIVLIGYGILLAQEPAANIKDRILKQIGPIISVTGPDLKPSLWIECGCEDVLDGKGFMLVKDMNIYIYNSGNSSSSSATGKVEFYDELTNSNKTYNFTVGVVASKGWGITTPNKVNGPFIVKKANGIKISVTFKDLKGVSKTNTVTQNSCSHFI